MKLLTELITNLKFSSLALAVSFLTLSCANKPTPAKRIAERPEVFEALPERYKDLVSEGRITRGMSKEAVSLAWGSPTNEREGEREDRAFTEWIYMGSRAQPIQQTGFFFDPYWGGPWRPGFHPAFGGGWGGWGGNAFMWVPEERARVTFINSKVDSWMNGGRPR